MKQIPLTQGKFALVDDEDYEKLSQSKWNERGTRTNVYARTQGGLSMHRLLMGSQGDEIDHIDGNGLNNQKSNLRVCTRAENSRNRKLGKTNKSGYKGVSWKTENKKWQVAIMKDAKQIHLGYFFCLIKAAKAYDKAAKKLFGEFAKLNFPS